MFPFSDSETGCIDAPATENALVLEDPLYPWADVFEAGGDVLINSESGGGVSMIPSANFQGQGANNSVLLGQFTTDGTFSFNISLGISLFENDEIITTDYLWCEGNIPSLSYVSGSCTASTACNYNPDATSDDGSCVYPGDLCDDGDENTSLEVYQEDCTCGRRSSRRLHGFRSV